MGEVVKRDKVVSPTGQRVAHFGPLQQVSLLARKGALTFGMKPTMHDTRDSSVGRAGDCSW